MVVFFQLHHHHHHHHRNPRDGRKEAGSPEAGYLAGYGCEPSVFLFLRLQIKSMEKKATGSARHPRRGTFVPLPSPMGNSRHRHRFGLPSENLPYIHLSMHRRCATYSTPRPSGR